MEQVSKTQIDRLGDRLRKRPVSDEDLRALDEYRKSFHGTYADVITMIKQELNVYASGRPAKSTKSIIEKLEREHIRLSQMQDIAGCRIVVSNIDQQDNLIDSIRKVFPTISIVDRRIRPSYGYRAVHVIIKAFNKVIEIQIRTELQHSWAELSEKLSDEIDMAIKYGGGNERIQKTLKIISGNIESYENLDKKIATINDDLSMRKMRTQMIDVRKEIISIINAFRKRKP
jgi:ppGpp synthetase/RelA/SpoT-type nucleotidyltranferase